MTPVNQRNVLVLSRGVHGSGNSHGNGIPMEMGNELD